MPELPDVAYFKRYLESTALGKPVAVTHVLDDDVLNGISVQKLQRSLKGETMRTTQRHGKYLFVKGDGPMHLVLHFGMTGYLDYAVRNGSTPRSTRMVIDLENGYRLAYVCQRKLGLVSLTDAPAQFAEDRQLGPDALAPRFDAAAFRRRVGKRRGTIKSTLMNQSLLAGIGNVYADEILFQARIDPRRRTDAFEDAELDHLHGTMRDVLKTAIRHEAKVANLPATFLLPRREEDGHCPACDGRLTKLTVARRTTYLCEHCQR